MKHELKQLRRWAEGRIRTGSVPDWSWPNHVRLIEAIDAVMQDLALMQGQSQHGSLLSDRIHILPRLPRKDGGYRRPDRSTAEQPKARRSQ